MCMNCDGPYDPQSNGAKYPNYDIYFIIAVLFIAWGIYAYLTG